MRSIWRERRMATACRDRTQCADGVKAVGVAGGVFTRTSQASAFSVSQPGGPGLASRAQDTLAFGGIGGANRRHGPGVRSLARPCLATPPTTANSFYCVLMLAYCLRRRSNPPSTRRRPRKTIVTRRLDFHLWKFALTCARFLGIRCHSEGYRLIGERLFVLLSMRIRTMLVMSILSDSFLDCPSSWRSILPRESSW